MVKVGDRLFAVSQRGRHENGRWIVVEKVGRKWASFKNEGFFGGGRFDIETFRIDGGGMSNAGRIYQNEESYRAELRINSLWSELRRKFDRMYSRPDHLDEIGILKAADALGIKLKGE